MVRFCSLALMVLSVTFGSTAALRAQDGRDRDREGSVQDADRERAPRLDEGERPGRTPERERPRPGEDEEGTEEGMPSAQFAPPGQPGARFLPAQWKLGVYASNTDTGVRITRVIPRTPAFQAGLERGDKIVTVDGYQIGFVKGRLYPLGEELQRRAGRNGHVTLLVHNWRNGELLNVEVQLERRR
jgi:hypothetical protein